MNTFYDTKVKDAILYVPDASVNAYKEASQWKEFGTIKPISEMPSGVVIGEGIDQITNDKSQMTNKVLRDGVVLIEQNGKTFTVQGQEVK